MGLDLVVPSDEEEWEDWVERRAREKREAREAMARAQVPVPALISESGRAKNGGGQEEAVVNGEKKGEGEMPVAESSKMAQMRLRNASATNGSPRSRGGDASAMTWQSGVNVSAV